MKSLPSAQSYSQNPNFFIGSKKEKICDWKKISVKEVFYFYISSFGVVASLALKIVVCYESAKFKLFEN